MSSYKLQVWSSESTNKGDSAGPSQTQESIHVTVVRNESIEVSVIEIVCPAGDCFAFFSLCSKFLEAQEAWIDSLEKAKRSRLSKYLKSLGGIWAAGSLYSALGRDLIATVIPSYSQDKFIAYLKSQLVAYGENAVAQNFPVEENYFENNELRAVYVSLLESDKKITLGINYDEGVELLVELESAVSILTAVDSSEFEGVLDRNSKLSMAWAISCGIYASDDQELSVLLRRQAVRLACFFKWPFFENAIHEVLAGINEQYYAYETDRDWLESQMTGLRPIIVSKYPHIDDVVISRKV